MMSKSTEDACRGSRYLQICGQLVCHNGYMKMMGIGKHRFSVIGQAVRRGDAYCPFDLRYIPRTPKKPSPKWTKVYDYLMEMYTNVAEVIPDGLNSNKRPRQGKFKIDNPNMDRTRIKHLPSGSINEYHKQCQAAVKDDSISRKLFCSVPCLTLCIFSYMESRGFLTFWLIPMRTQPFSSLGCHPD